MDSMACTVGAVSAGAYVTRPAFDNIDGKTISTGDFEEGQYAPWSSLGTTVDGRQLPVTAAPGCMIISVASTPYVESHPDYEHVTGSKAGTDRTDYWALEYGTSMVELALYVELNTIVAAQLQILFWHCEFVVANEIENRLEETHCCDERMDSAAIFKVANHCYGQTFELALCLENRVEVEHGLRRMLVCTVTGIDNRRFSDACGIFGSSFNEMAHYNEVGIVGYHFNGILQCLAF